MNSNKSAFWLLAIVLAVTTMCWPQAHEKQPKRAIPLGYELYSWQADAKSTQWDFSLPYTTNREKTVKEVLNPQTTLHGVEQLKKKVAGLATGSTIVWADRLTFAGQRLKGSERLSYPPPEIREEIRNYVESRHIELVENTDYLLYSWEAPNGGWDFQLLKVGNHEKTVDEIFDGRTVLHGVDQLAAKLSSVESGSYIVWSDARAVRGSGSERLHYPSADVVKQIRADASKRKIKVAGP